MEFASSLRCVELDEIIEQFKHKPFKDQILAGQEDCIAFQLEEKKLPAAKSSEYLNYRRPRGDHVQFTVKATADTFVMLKDMFQLGWEAQVNGEEHSSSKLDLFPAYYMFMGFELPPGEHTLEFKFIPPLLYWGALVNLICLGILLLTAIKRRKA